MKVKPSRTEMLTELDTKGAMQDNKMNGWKVYKNTPRSKHTPLLNGLWVSTLQKHIC